jgi:hypothetical protein
MPRRRRWTARRVIALGFVVAAVFPLLYGLGLVYQHSRSPSVFAEIRCDERFPSKGSDQVGRLDCLDRERSLNAGAIMRPYGIPAMALLVTGGMLWIFGRPQDAEHPAPLDVTVDELDLPGDPGLSDDR